MFVAIVVALRLVVGADPFYDPIRRDTIYDPVSTIAFEAVVTGARGQQQGPTLLTSAIYTE